MDEKLLLEFLISVDKSFPVSLSEKVDLKELTNKLTDKGTLCYEKIGSEICSLVAGYTDNLIDNIAFISIVVTTEHFKGKGLAGKAIKQFIDICKEKKISAVHLYTDQTNKSAIKLYEKLGFRRTKFSNEPRPDDIHFIYYLNKE